jgi:hypothetical protein
VSAWIENKLGGSDSLCAAVAAAGGFLVVDDFLPVNVAAGVESLLLRSHCIPFHQLHHCLTPVHQLAPQRVEQHGGAGRYAPQ